MKSRIETALKKHFERTRIVFWYDDKKEFRETFDKLELDGVVLAPF